MRTTLPVLVLALLTAPAARADVSPPRGLKHVQIDYTITTEKDYPEYAFFTVVCGDEVRPVELGARKPLLITGAGRGGCGRYLSLVATPKDAAKRYKSEKEFYAAIAADKVPGQVRANASFDSRATIRTSDPRMTVVMEYRLDRIDARDGIVISLVSDPIDTGITTAGWMWGTGSAASAAAILGGLWVVRRQRRKVRSS